MTANLSDEARALRLPRDFALIAAGLDLAMFVIGTAVMLMPGTEHSEQLRSAFARPDVWIMTLAGLAAPLTMAAVLAWSHGRNALERRGVANVALAQGARLRFGIVCALVVVLNYYVLGQLFPRFRFLFGSPGWLEFSPFLAIGLALLVQWIGRLVVLVLGLWLAARIALGRGHVATVGAQGDAAVEVAGAAPRRAGVTVFAAVFASLHLWSGLLITNSVAPSNDGVPKLLLTLVLPWLVAFAIAFWGAWLGTRPGLPLARPFRAVTASVSTFVLVQVSSFVIAAVGTFVATSNSMGRLHGLGSLVAFVAVVLVYIVLVVVIGAVVMRRFYRRDL
ncbi:hypothetical protein NU688_27615 [Variovorax sp. ZS18.2.2]|uniref:hypothetical protein n=1 Tax=Variovorax sp. ZS18.2.2 TaxID=2971255 RepID=UPI00215125F4|nr:hypothetical protein [Variovorax sp. ZS18.2.2]MCR6479952.1 hypothetical protein [Variovorax sp. ZS18.2.2]